ncbi:GNAT family N-acetyltransferase [Vibrio genomosp. F10]|uniref:GNAT family N-acetyltransferase n=1 Tax=Vibrio genomosp. F10 TaxID=723171 RepID=UPI0002F3D59F|nr:GNAT family N-acetyltransferase [Vibrio genomosp. F10]OEF03961.1 aerobactin siderophore synthesis protein IucB [Vibrio genomosp. F10 str. 9ZB36]
MPNYTTFLYEMGDIPVVTLTQTEQDLNAVFSLDSVMIELDQFFTIHKDIDEIDIQCGSPTLRNALRHCLPMFETNRLNRQAFYQRENPWHQHAPSSSFPTIDVQSNPQFRHHPLRPPMPRGTVYKRYDHEADVTVSFRVFDIDKDMPLFTQWMNDPRVADFWEQAWSEDKLRQFAQERLADAHIIPLIGEFNGQPFGYVEVYWVSEDRLSPYYSVEPYDRGIHLLVGEQQFRGPKYFISWMKAISHYLFIDDIRTRRIVLEPRSDNIRLFKRIEQVGYKTCFEFNFPHKRSALLMLERNAFFKEQW